MYQMHVFINLREKHNKFLMLTQKGNISTRAFNLIYLFIFKCLKVMP